MILKNYLTMALSQTPMALTTSKLKRMKMAKMRKRARPTEQDRVRYIHRLAPRPLSEHEPMLSLYSADLAS